MRWPAAWARPRAVCAHARGHWRECWTRCWKTAAQGERTCGLPAWALLGPQNGAQRAERRNQPRRPLRQLVLAQRALVRLEHAAQQQRVYAGIFLLIPPKLHRLEAAQLRNPQRLDGIGNGAPCDGIGKDEGEVALDRLEAGEFVRGGTAERERVERGEVYFGEEDRLAKLAGFALGRRQFAEARDRLARQDGCSRAACLQPCGSSGDKGQGRAAQVEETKQRLNGPFQLEEGSICRRVEIACRHRSAIG